MVQLAAEVVVRSFGEQTLLLRRRLDAERHGAPCERRQLRRPLLDDGIDKVVGVLDVVVVPLVGIGGQDDRLFLGQRIGVNDLVGPFPKPECLQRFREQPLQSGHVGDMPGLIDEICNDRVYPACPP